MSHTLLDDGVAVRVVVIRSYDRWSVVPDTDRTVGQGDRTYNIGTFDGVGDVHHAVKVLCSGIGWVPTNHGVYNRVIR